MPACTNLYLRKTDRIKLPLYALFDQTVFDLYAVELFEHGLCGDVQEKHRGKGVDAVHGKARDVVGQDHFCVYRPAAPQKHRVGCMAFFISRLYSSAFGCRKCMANLLQANPCRVQISAHSANFHCTTLCRDAFRFWAGRAFQTASTSAAYGAEIPRRHQ